MPESLRIKPLNIKELSRQRKAGPAISFPMDRYIRASAEYTTEGHWVPAPLFRKSFSVKPGLRSAKLLINGLGLYELYCNGKDITKGPLAPYRSNPILFNDYHLGECYDARKELTGWNSPDYDDSGWALAQAAPTPRGEARLCEAEPIGYFEEMEPVQVLPYEGGYIYDFGVNFTGLCRLCIQGEKGQTVQLDHFEQMLDGKPFGDQIRKPPASSSETPIFAADDPRRAGCPALPTTASATC